MGVRVKLYRQCTKGLRSGLRDMQESLIVRELAMPTPDETALYVYTAPPVAVLEGI